MPGLPPIVPTISPGGDDLASDATPASPSQLVRSVEPVRPVPRRRLSLVKVSAVAFVGCFAIAVYDLMPRTQLIDALFWFGFSLVPLTVGLLARRGVIGGGRRLLTERRRALSDGTKG